MTVALQKRSPSPKRFGHVLRNIFGTLFAIVFVAILASLLPIKGMYKLYTVQSGSMEPKIPTGSLVVVIPSDSYTVGDVITYTDPENSKSTTTHRIVGTNGTSYRTKGDANDSADPDPVPFSNVVGNVVVHLPYVGYPVGYAKTLPGLLILIIIPSTIIIWEELKTLRGEWRATRKDQTVRERKGPARKKNITVRKVQPIKKTSGNVPIGVTIFVLLTTVSAATLSIKAFFNDREPASGSLTSGAWQTNCLVINEVYYDVDAAHGLDGEDMNGNKSNGNQNNNPDEWIELYNNCDQDISLKNWAVTDNEHTVAIHASKSVPGHGYGLISKSASTWTQYWGFSGLGNETSIRFIEIGEGGAPIYQVLDNAGDMVQLKNADGRIIDQMSYGNDGTVWKPAIPVVAEGGSLSRNPAGHDTDQPGDFAANGLPSPGQPAVTPI